MNLPPHPQPLPANSAIVFTHLFEEDKSARTVDRKNNEVNVFKIRALDDQLNSDVKFVIAGFIPAIHRGAGGIYGKHSAC